MSIRDLAAASGLTKSLLSRIENAKANPCLTTLEKLAAAFGQTSVTFVREVEARIAHRVPNASTLKGTNHAPRR